MGNSPSRPYSRPDKQIRVRSPLPRKIFFAAREEIGDYSRTIARVRGATIAAGRRLRRSRDEELIAAYLDDSLTEAETAELNDWRKADANNVKRFALANVREDRLRQTVVSNATLRAATEE